ncbi:YceI family protein [Roseibium algae]|uniref:YceI family protein n=1 Tax=Roseibium algae TaxID=3123038 RepID=A0ABU8TMY9_9HYPH
MKSKKPIQDEENQGIRLYRRRNKVISASLCSLAVLLPLASLTSATAAPITVKGKYTLSAKNLETRFSVKVIGGSKITGVFKSVHGQMSLNSLSPQKSSVKVTVDLDSVETENPLITNFLKGPSMFDVKNHPTADFISTRVSKVDEKTANVEGVLDMRGKRQRTSLTVSLTGKDPNGTIHFTVNGGFFRGLYGMNIGQPIYGDKVRLNISGTSAPR